MKKFILLAASAALVLGACSKNVVTSVDDEAIGFGTYAPTSVTKADGSYASSTALPSGQKFVVYGYNQGSSDFASSLVPSFMNGVEVTTNITNVDLTSYTPLRYWPKDEANNKLAFYAYYPLNTTNITPTVTSGLGSYSFKVNSAIGSQSDFMIAGLQVDQTYTSTSGTVALAFKHQLTKVRFVVKTDAAYPNTDITVTSVVLNKVKTQGTLTPTYTSGTGTSTAWTDQAEAATPISFTVPNVNVVLTTAAQPATEAAGDCYLMLPQDLADEVEAVVTYTVKTGTDAEVINTQKIQLNTVKKNATDVIGKWDKNQNIVYTITIGLKPIKFTATVENWDAATNGGISIN